jgi:hypothetical protein
MLSLFQKVVARIRPPAEKTPEDEMDDYLRNLRAASREELSGVLAGAMLARKTLDTTRQVSTPFPADYLDGRTPLDESGRAHLAAYGQELKSFQRACVSSGTILSLAVAKGLDTWIMSVSALAIPALIGKGREAWWLLMQGEQSLEQAYRFMVRRDMTDVDFSYLGYRPAALAPKAA